MPVRVLFTCGREPSYPRNAMMLAGLERSFQVTAVTDTHPNILLRYANVVRKLLRTRWEDFDLVFVGFLGQPLIPFVNRLTLKPVLFDAFLSVYDTLCFDRARFSPDSVPGKAAFWLDQTTCAQADRVILDTQNHAAYFHSTFGVGQEKLHSIYVGCDENLFYPQSQDPTILPQQGQPPQVLFYGSYLPLHGTDVIVRAAAQVQAVSNVRFRLIGKGIELKKAARLAESLGTKNIEFLPPVPLQDLPKFIAQASLCLGGHFGSSEKAGRVIAGKTFQCLAMGKATIVGDNLANRELLTHGYDAWFCPMNDPASLASSILTLLGDADLRRQLGENAYSTFMEKASLRAITAQICDIVKSMVEP